ncbi:MAG: hypothetical protein KIT34_08465 [Cyanobacteria bacterium TGS_CYA1]|nr:hypothetical protein [Cyanobacteria bacterium TGS_CYA1]
MLNNSKSIKAPSRATAMWLPVACVILFGAKLACDQFEAKCPPSFHDHVQWRNIQDAKLEAKSRQMPIFEVVTSDFNGEHFKTLERYYFSDPTLANAINKDYIPARSISKSSNNQWGPHFGYDRDSKTTVDFANVRVIPLDLQERSCDDYRLPHLYHSPGFKQNVLVFLAENKNYNSSYNVSIAKHDWCKLADVEAKAKKENKKILYFFYQQYNDTCYNVMQYPFNDYDKKKLLDKHFACSIVMERATPVTKNPVYVDKLVKKYEVQSYPSLVSVDPNTGKFEKLGGTCNRSEIDDFLKKESAK